MAAWTSIIPIILIRIVPRLIGEDLTSYTKENEVAVCTC
jgi:hypothetical protein